MQRKGSALFFLMTPDHFYPTTIMDSHLLLEPYQRETPRVGKSYVKSKRKTYKTHISTSFGPLYSLARRGSFMTRFL